MKKKPEKNQSKPSKTVGKIFYYKNLSSRFHRYQKDPSRRGRSQYLNQMLMHLKKEFPEFSKVLGESMTQIRTIGEADEETKRKNITKSMRNYAATLAEISDDTHLIQAEIREILLKMEAEKLVRRVKNTISDDHRDDHWFLNEK